MATHTPSVVLTRYPDDYKGGLSNELPDGLRLWRYMSFEQFAHILASGSLWLAALRDMEDRREGTWIKLSAKGPPGVDISAAEATLAAAFDYAAEQTYISSWIAADDEQLAMWNTYAPGRSGVAIATDVRGLLDALGGPGTIKDDSFMLMRVEYHEQPHPVAVQFPGPVDPNIWPKHKSSDFEFENEVRVVYGRSVLTAVDRDRNTIAYESVPAASGASFKIRSMTPFARHGIVVAPRAPAWVLDAVRSLMRQYGHDGVEVRPSRLTEQLRAAGPPPFESNIVYH